MRRNITRKLEGRRPLKAAAFALALLAASAFAGGITLARFSSSKASGADTFASGTVSGSGSVLQSCNLSSVLPGTTTSDAELSAAGNTSITSGTNSGVTVSALAKQITSGDALLIGQATGTVKATATATAAAGATAISFSATSSSTGSFPQSFAQGSLVTDLTSQKTSSPTPCKFQFTYGGSVSEYVAVDLLVVSGDASHPKLWDPSAAGLELEATDASNNVFALPTATTTCPSSGPLASSVPAGTLACGLALDDVLSTSAVSSGTFTVTLNWGLPIPAPTGDQNGNTTVLVLFHSVQAGNNALKCSVTPSSAGQPCNPSSPFSWS